MTYIFDDIKIGNEVYFELSHFSNQDVHWIVKDKGNGGLCVEPSMGIHDRRWIEVKDVINLIKIGKRD